MVGFWSFNIKGTNISWLDLKDIIESQYEGLFIWRDSNYIIPDDPLYILQESPSLMFEYVKNGRDCDDGNRILRGWLSTKGYGNVLAMDIAVTYPDGFSHALIGFLDKNKKLIFGDARTGKMVTLPTGTTIERIIA